MHFHGHERVYSGEIDELICSCIGVDRRAVEAEVDGGAKTVAQVGDRCGAGGGCGECHPEIARLLMAALGPSLPSTRGMSPEEAVQAILAPLAEAIGARIQIEPGDPSELVLRVIGDDDQKQTIALWAELRIDPLLGADRFLEVE